MLIYILKSSACLAILMLIYKLVFEKTSIHKFKRFYLLGILGLAFTIPLITFTEYIEPHTSQIQLTSATNDFIFNQNIIEEDNANYLAAFIASIYGLGMFFFLIKFSLNLSGIILRIKHNPKYKKGSFINVLIENLSVPHTFLNYIFFNKLKFENNEIPSEVILHEQTHAKQKHSLDIILIELLQIIFWFNPLIYLLKKDIKLNHEFLADSAVINHGVKPSEYQQLLLVFSSNTTEHQLASAINYSSIKKRFTVMKTHTSKTSIWLRSLLLLPLLGILFYGFCEREQIEKETIQSVTKKDAKQEHTSRVDIELNINDKGELLYNNELITMNDLASIYTLENDMSISITTTLDVKKEVTSSITRRIQAYLKEQGLKKFSVCIVAEKNSKPEGAKSKQIDEYNRLAKHYNSQPKNKRIIKRTELERLEYLYGLMSATQKKNAQPFPDCPPPPPPPPTVVKGHEVITGFVKIKGTPHYWVEINNRKRYFNRKGFEVSKTGKVLSDTQINASDVIPGQYITKVYTDGKVVAEFKNNKPNSSGELNIPLPPKEPKSPQPLKIELKETKNKSPKVIKGKQLKEVTEPKTNGNQSSKIEDIEAKLNSFKSKLSFVSEMAEDDSLRFCYNGKTISRDRAIRIAKNNPKVHIRLGIAHNTGQNIIYLSKRKPLIGYKG